MAKYLVETFYTCSFKVNHYIEDLNEKELEKLEKRDDGKFEIIDIKMDNRKTKNLDKLSNNSDNKSTILDTSKVSNSSPTSAVNKKVNSHSKLNYIFF